MHNLRYGHGLFSRCYRLFIEFGRYAWLDLPMVALIYFFLRHQLTQGIHPAPEWFTYFYWAELGLYLPVKADAHRRYPGMRTRWGSVRVGIWIVFIIFSALLNSQCPDRYMKIPPLLPETVLIVIGVFFFGAWASKKRVLEQLGKFVSKHAK